MTVTDRVLTPDEIRAALNGKRDHLRDCTHAHRQECAELTWLEMDALLEALHEQVTEG